MSIKQTWVIHGQHTMHCAGCVQTVEFSLSQLSGVERVKANRNTQQIEVQVTVPQVGELVVAELDSLGYKVKEIDNDSTNK